MFCIFVCRPCDLPRMMSSTCRGTGVVSLHEYLCLCWWTESRSPGLTALEEEAAPADWEPTSAPEGRPLSRSCPCWDSTRCAQVNDLHRQTGHGQVTKSGTTIRQQFGKALTSHWPTTRKYWSNSPTLTDSSSDSLMERQQHRQTSGSPESIMSNTDRDGENFTKRANILWGCNVHCTPGDKLLAALL